MRYKAEIEAIQWTGQDDFKDWVKEHIDKDAKFMQAYNKDERTPALVVNLKGEQFTILPFSYLVEVNKNIFIIGQKIFEALFQEAGGIYGNL